MTGPQTDLSPYKDEIVDLINQQKPTETICIELGQRYSIKISDRTLGRRLKEWGIRRLPPKTANNKALCDRIQSLVRDNYTDKEILPTLHQEGFKIAEITLKRLRQQLGLRLRTNDPEARSLQEQQIKEVVQREIQDGNIEGYGRGLLHTHLRQQGYLFPR
jgi:transposase